MPGFQKISPSTFETTADPAVVSQNDISALIAAAQAASNGRARLILHPDRQDSLHEMIIALPPESCDHPHINFRSGKSFLALSGQFAVVTFSDDGGTIEPYILSADRHWAGNRMIRLRKPAWHTVIPLVGDTVFLETIMGPFEGNKFADWFPDTDQSDERAAWTARLRHLAVQAATAMGDAK